jgi:hypothetical protein
LDARKLGGQVAVVASLRSYCIMALDWLVDARMLMVEVIRDSSHAAPLMNVRFRSFYYNNCSYRFIGILVEIGESILAQVIISRARRNKKMSTDSSQRISLLIAYEFVSKLIYHVLFSIFLHVKWSSVISSRV